MKKWQQWIVATLGFIPLTLHYQEIRRLKLEKNAEWHDAYRRGKEAEARKAQPESLTPPCPGCHRLMTLISRANWICEACAELPEIVQPPALPLFGGQSVRVQRPGDMLQRYQDEMRRHGSGQE